MSWLLLLRAEQWLALVFAAAGIYLGMWFAQDNRRDLLAYRARGWDSFAELSGIQGVRSGRAKAGLHLMLAVVPLAGLMVVPPPSRYLAGVLVYAALDVGQALVIWAQAANWRDRGRLLRRLADPSTPTGGTPS